MNETVRVPVKSAWLSKINWTQAISLGASVLAVKGINLDTETQLAIVATIQGVQSVATWAFRTFANNTVNPASIGQ